MKAKITFFIAIFLVTINLTFAQNAKEEISLASLKGVFCIPIGTNKSTAGIKIKIPANTPDVVQFKISWGDGKSETFKVDYPKSSKDTFDIREHEFLLEIEVTHS